MDDLMMPAGATPEPEAAPAPGDESYEKHLGHMVAAIMNDGMLTVEQKRKKLLAACKLLDETEEEPGLETPIEEEAEEAEEEEEEPMEESWNKRLQSLESRLVESEKKVKVLEGRLTAKGKVKAPVSAAPARTPASKPLTVDDLLAGVTD